ncbi:hypothetical protein A2397_03145 [Candidatus Amesbacteria bacterium RIFOXYB1_FULL_44_23]|uniref:Uncharacterized protein n=1 Tax=Candidatus Amesbacteria bacterium RIFOXYB1_FULL_44_23 TaxID=1797263 RepID=A0A1F4ZPH1_9BACT|nr:MAG: hypothetical protein A2397_03145 [Candidatus Amesbacteria bacterium RIFOXYB1_FULL_44_23]
MLTTANAQSLVKVIVEQQRMIIGPLAVEQANKVDGLTITVDLNEVTISGDPKKILMDLVDQYRRLFGQVSVEACKESIKKTLHQIPRQDIPDFLV